MQKATVGPKRNGQEMERTNEDASVSKVSHVRRTVCFAGGGSAAAAGGLFCRTRYRGTKNEAKEGQEILFVYSHTHTSTLQRDGLTRVVAIYRSSSSGEGPPPERAEPGALHLGSNS